MHMQPGCLVKNLCALPMFTSIPGADNFTNDWVYPIIPDAPRNTPGIILEIEISMGEPWVRWFANGHVGWSNSHYLAEVG